MDDVKRLEEIFDEMLGVYKKKNSDYGNSVEETYKRYGLVSFLVRIEDKVNRLYTLQNKQAQVQDEKIEDTLMDLANYSAMALMMYRKNKNK